MNWKDAAKAALDGAKVRRTRWVPERYIQICKDGELRDVSGLHASMPTQGDDWELFVDPIVALRDEANNLARGQLNSSTADFVAKGNDRGTYIIGDGTVACTGGNEKMALERFVAAAKALKAAGL